MPLSETIRAGSDAQDALRRSSGLRLPRPLVISGLLVGFVLLLRLPSALVPREFNVDESQLLSEAVKFVAHPTPWKGVDSCGPLDSYLISAFLLMGFKAGYVLVHLLASVLACLQVLMAYLTLRRLASDATAALGGALMAFLYGTYTHLHYLHYNTELLPTLLLMMGFYFFLVWLDEAPGRSPGMQLVLLFVCGLALGSAPWGKLQALPITVALGLLTLAAIFRHRSLPVNPLRRANEIAAFASGGWFSTVVMLAIITKSGALRDFWYSYIQAPLNYAGGFSVLTSLENLARVALVTPVHQLLLVAAVGLALLDYALPKGEFRLLFKRQRWAFSGLLVYAGAALFTASRSRYFWPHHAIFFIPPMTYVAALLAGRGVTALIQSLRSQQRSGREMLLALLGPLILIGATLALYVTYGVRYIHKVAVIHELYDARDTSQGITEQKDPLAAFIGARNWAVPEDGHEEMAAVVADLQKTHPVRSLAIWGWEPGVYVMTGIVPATRDTITQHAIDKEPFEQYFRTRFVNDLRANPPDLFIDAVAKGAFLWPTWTENDGYESDPALRNFISENYVLAKELTLAQGAKPVRFFVRRTPGT